MTRASTKSKGRRARTSGTGARAAPTLPFEVAICETGNAHHRRAAEVVAALGYRVAPEIDADAVIERMVERGGPDLVLVGLPGREALVQAALARGLDRPVLVGAVAGPADTARARCVEAGVDLFTLRPHSRDSLAAALRAAEAVIAERQKVIALEGSERLLRERLQRYGQADQTTGFRHFDFFQQLLVLELKRAKRYGYSLAACLVGIDPWADAEPPPDAARQLRIRVAQAIGACIRDIDLPVELADDRFLVFLPYTDLEGAERVGKRIAAAARSFGNITEGERTFRMSVSVGIAAMRPGKPLSFARLMREAQAAVRAGQLKGGGKVVVRR